MGPEGMGGAGLMSVRQADSQEGAPGQRLPCLWGSQAGTGTKALCSHRVRSRGWGWL